jgi:hypothetical protein
MSRVAGAVDFFLRRASDLAYNKAMARTAFLTRLAALAALLALPGCLVKTAVDVATLPVKVAAKGVNAALPSQKKRDQKRGKAIRKYEECLGREERKAAKERRPMDQSRCGEAP